MKDIKTKESKKDIKTLNRAAGLAKVTKNATVRTKDQVQNLSDDGQITPDEYAEDKIKYMAESAVEDTGKAAKKTVQKTYDGGKRHRQRIRRRLLLQKPLLPPLKRLLQVLKLWLRLLPLAVG